MLPWTSWSMQRSFWLAKGLVHLWRGRLLSLGMPVPAWLTALRCHCCRAMGSTSSAYSWHLLFPTEQSFCFLWCKMCALLPWILAVNIGICLHLFRLWFGGGNGVLSLSFFFFPLVLHYALTLYKTHENLTLLKSQSQGCATLPWIPWCSI